MKAIFLDRDGVLNPLLETDEGKVSPQNLEDFNLFDGIEESIARAKNSGFELIVFTNQPDVDKSWRELNEEKLGEINQYLRNIGVDSIYQCIHGPEGNIEDKRYMENGEITVCECRKPQAKLIRDAVKENDVDMSKSYVIGDNSTDLEAASRYEKESKSKFKAKFSVGEDFDEADRTFDNTNTAIRKIIEEDQS